LHRRIMPVEYVYVLVRADLTPKQQMVQAIHAALEAGYVFRELRAEQDEHWLVLCTVPDEQALHDARAHLEQADIGHYVFHEPDDGLGYTALATQPIEKRQRKHLRRFELWG